MQNSIKFTYIITRLVFPYMCSERGGLNYDENQSELNVKIKKIKNGLSKSSQYYYFLLST